jgi:N-acetylmuramoyl-L-alanine amidase
MNYKVRKGRLAIDGNECRLVESPNVGGELQPILFVMHYTASGPNSDIAAYFANAAAKVSAHLVIRRDGTVIQCAPFDRIAWHAGKSTWTFADGQTRSGLNSFAVGIEMENWGPLQRSPAGWVSWTGVAVDSTRVIEAKHKYGSLDGGWETFTEQQIGSAVEAARAICSEYGITEVVGHDDIAPGRKSDPGPAWKMDSFLARVFGRADNGDASMIVRSTTGLNLRTGPGTNFPLAQREPLPNGTKVLPQEASGSWRLVTVLDRSGTGKISGWANANWLSLA